MATGTLRFPLPSSECYGGRRIQGTNYLLFVKGFVTMHVLIWFRFDSYFALLYLLEGL